MDVCSTECGYIPMVCFMYVIVWYYTFSYLITQACDCSVGVHNRTNNILLFHKWLMLIAPCRADGDWDDDDRRIYFNTSTSHLCISDFPYSGEVKEFDSNLGVHNTFDTFEIVGRYIFAQRTDSGMVALYVSDRRGPLQKAHIPIPGGHERYVCVCVCVYLLVSCYDDFVSSVKVRGVHH